MSLHTPLPCNTSLSTVHTRYLGQPRPTRSRRGQPRFCLCASCCPLHHPPRACNGYWPDPAQQRAVCRLVCARFVHNSTENRLGFVLVFFATSCDGWVPFCQQSRRPSRRPPRTPWAGPGTADVSAAAGQDSDSKSKIISTVQLTTSLRYTSPLLDFACKALMPRI